MHFPLVSPFLWPPFNHLCKHQNSCLILAGEEQGGLSREAAQSQHKPEIPLQSQVTCQSPRKLQFLSMYQTPRHTHTHRSPRAGKGQLEDAASQLRAEADSCEPFLPGNYYFVLHTHFSGSITMCEITGKSQHSSNVLSNFCLHF